MDGTLAWPCSAPTASPRFGTDLISGHSVKKIGDGQMRERFVAAAQHITHALLRAYRSPVDIPAFRGVVRLLIHFSSPPPIVKHTARSGADPMIGVKGPAERFARQTLSDCQPPAPCRPKPG